MRLNMHISVICIVETFLNMLIFEIGIIVPISNMHSQAVAEYAYFQNMHSHGFSLCRLSKIVEKSSDCRPLVETSAKVMRALGRY